MDDVRYGIRTLLKSPGFAVTVLLTIALGIAAYTTIFAVLNTVLLRPLPYPQSDRIAICQYRQSLPDLADIASMTRTFDAIGGATTQPQDYTGGKEPLQVQAALITAGLSRVLGITPYLGRTFTADEDKLGGEPLVLLTHSFWRDHLGADESIVGKMIPLSGRSYRVIGVLQPGFHLPLEDVDVLMLIRVVIPDESRDVHDLRTYIRLKEGVTFSAGQAEMKTMDHRLEEIDPIQNKDRQTVLIRLQERVSGPIRPVLLILFASVCFVLLIACTNFSNLMLARSTAREQEMAVRVSLGAGRYRIFRQLLAESILIAIAGGVLGLLLSIWSLEVLKTLEPANIPRLSEIRVDGTVLLFTFLSTLMVGILSGLAPAWSAISSDPAKSLKDGTKSATPGKRRRRLRSSMVITELALAMLLLVGAGLLVKTFIDLRSVNPGLDPQNVLTCTMQLPEARYKEIDKQERFRNALLSALNSRKEMIAGAVSELPFSGEALDHNFVIVGRPPLEPGTEPSIFARSISGRYFASLQIPLLRGRNFTLADHTDAPPVGIVNEAMVRRYFPNQDPIGAQIRWAYDKDYPPVTIVGVAGDVRHFGFDQPDEPSIYMPYSQANAWKRWISITVRSTLPSSDVVNYVKGEVWKIDPQLPVTKIQTMSQLMASSLKEHEFNMLLLGILALIALGLALIGLYGAVAYMVGQRSHEIGIRIALGANSNRILKLIIGEGAILTGTGIAIGIAGALVLTRLMARLLFGVSPKDPYTFLIVGLILGAVSLLACTVPAVRATKVDPAIALRSE